MRALLIFWALPMGFLWGWYFLSYNDLSFGITMLSRDIHETTFALYGHILGIEPEMIPPLLVRACVLDTFLLLGIVGFRRRRALRAWLASRRSVHRPGDLPSV